MKLKHPLHKCFLIISALCMVTIGFLSATNFSDAASTSSSSSSDSDYAVGDDIVIGKMDGKVLSWTILSYDTSTNDALVVSTYPIGSKYPYYNNFMKTLNANYPDKSKTGFINWKNSQYRVFCKNMYNDCFTSAEKSMITNTIISSKSQKNDIMDFYHDTTLDAYYVANQSKNALSIDICNNMENTTDHVFFLSYNEYVSYSDTIKLGTSVYPLRTNSYDYPNMTLYVNESTGLIERKYNYSGNGVRPAMWINLAGTLADDSDDSSGTNSGSTSTTSSTTTSSSSTTSTATTYETINRRSYENNAKDSAEPAVNKITLPDDAAVTLGEEVVAQVSLDLSYLNFTDKQYTVTYASSDDSIFTVDSNGLLTTGTKAGGAVLTATMQKSNGKQFTMKCKVTVE